MCSEPIPSRTGRAAVFQNHLNTSLIGQSCLMCIELCGFKRTQKKSKPSLFTHTHTNSYIHPTEKEKKTIFALFLISFTSLKMIILTFKSKTFDLPIYRLSIFSICINKKIMISHFVSNNYIAI